KRVEFFSPDPRRDWVMPDQTAFADFIRRIRAGDAQAAAQLVQQYESVIRLEVKLRLSDPRLRRLFDSMDTCQSVMAISSCGWPSDTTTWRDHVHITFLMRDGAGKIVHEFRWATLSSLGITVDPATGRRTAPTPSVTLKPWVPSGREVRRFLRMSQRRP